MPRVMKRGEKEPIEVAIRAFCAEDRDILIVNHKHELLVMCSIRQRVFEMILWDCYSAPVGILENVRSGCLGNLCTFPLRFVANHGAQSSSGHTRSRS